MYAGPDRHLRQQGQSLEGVQDVLHLGSERSADLDVGAGIHAGQMAMPVVAFCVQRPAVRS